MEHLWRIELLGGLRAERDRVIVRFSGPKAGGLLAYLAFYRDRPHTREELASILWPEDWPGLLAPNTKKRREDFYSVYVPSEKLPELRRFLESRKQRGAVLISGKKMSAIYRFPFPGELEWMRSR